MSRFAASQDLGESHILKQLAAKEKPREKDPIEQLFDAIGKAWGDTTRLIYVYTDKKIAKYKVVFEALGMKPRDVYKLSYSFRTIDRDGSGAISLQEFTKYFGVGSLVTPLIERLFTLFDTDGNKQLDFKEFCAAVWLYCCGEEETINALCFDLGNKNQVGTMTKERLVELLLDAYGGKKRMNSATLAKLESIEKSGSFPPLSRKDFANFAAQQPALFFPITSLQKNLQNGVVGAGFWKKMTLQRKRHFGDAFSLRAIRSIITHSEQLMKRGKSNLTARELEQMQKRAQAEEKRQEKERRAQAAAAKKAAKDATSIKGKLAQKDGTKKKARAAGGNGGSPRRSSKVAPGKMKKAKRAIRPDLANEDMTISLAERLVKRRRGRRRSNSALAGAADRARKRDRSKSLHGEELPKPGSIAWRDVFIDFLKKHEPARATDAKAIHRILERHGGCERQYYLILEHRVEERRHRAREERRARRERRRQQKANDARAGEAAALAAADASMAFLSPSPRRRSRSKSTAGVGSLLSPQTANKTPDGSNTWFFESLISDGESEARPGSPETDRHRPLVALSISPGRRRQRRRRRRDGGGGGFVSSDGTSLSELSENGAEDSEDFDDDGYMLTVDDLSHFKISGGSSPVRRPSGSPVRRPSGGGRDGGRRRGKGKKGGKGKGKGKGKKKGTRNAVAPAPMVLPWDVRQRKKREAVKREIHKALQAGQRDTWFSQCQKRAIEASHKGRIACKRRVQEVTFWICPVCSFESSLSLKRCEMCAAPRPAGVDS